MIGSKRTSRTISSAIFLRQYAKTEDAFAFAMSRVVAASLRTAKQRLNQLPLPDVFDPDELADLLLDVGVLNAELIDAILPVLAHGMSEVAIGFFLSLGIDLRRRRSVTAQVKSTASEWLDNNSDVSLPPGIATDMPDWMKEEIASLLRETFSQDYWQTIAQTTRNDLRAFLAVGSAEGWSVERIAKELTQAFPSEYSKQRARLVARTECGNALNGARNTSYERMKRELPNEVAQHVNKSWISVLGNTTRDAHANLDGTMADVDGMFDLNGVRIPWPAHYALPASDRCNCQCTLGMEFGVGAPGLDEITDMLV